MKKSIIYGAILIVFFVIGSYLGHHLKKTQPTSQRKIAYWVAPMDPNYRRDKPGKSPMGMDLIPVYDDQRTPTSGIVKISAQVINNLGVRTAEVKKHTLPRVIDTVGYVTENEDHIEQVNTYTSGWIQNLYINKTGELVKKGQLLAEIYAPTLVNAQEEYLLALKSKNTDLTQAGEKKLLTLGVSSQQINQLRQHKKTTRLIKIFAPQNGIVSRLNSRKGVYVTPKQSLMTLSDLSTIWVIAEVFERQADWVANQQSAIATFSYLPGKQWKGQIDYVYPELDNKTHTLRVRIVFPNADLRLKPNMYAHLKIFAKPIPDILAIPREALIRTGHGDRVVLAVGHGEFRVQPVTVGFESGNWIAVTSGLTVGDMVVISAQFLIDSESNLRASMNRMSHH